MNCINLLRTTTSVFVTKYSSERYLLAELINFKNKNLLKSLFLCNNKKLETQTITAFTNRALNINVQRRNRSILNRKQYIDNSSIISQIVLLELFLIDYKMYVLRNTSFEQLFETVFLDKINVFVIYAFKEYLNKKCFSSQFVNYFLVCLVLNAQ